MKDVEQYNGWTNYETWLANLWLTVSETNYENILRAKKHTRDTYGRADWLKQHLLEQLDDEADDASLWHDLLTAAFYRVNWVEVIEKNQ